MTIEQIIKDTMEIKMKDGTVEKLVAEHLEKGIQSALENLFRSYGDITKQIESQIKSVMIPYLEKYDYSEYILKLDNVLAEVLKNSTSENRALITNFKELMTTSKVEEEINLSDLFERWTKYVAENVDTSDLEVVYEEGVIYEDVEVSLNVEYVDGKDWSSYKDAIVTFECEKDEDMNFEVRLHRWKNSSKEGWDILYNSPQDIKSLKNLNEWEILLMRLSQNYSKIIIDTDGENDYVTPEKEPEPSFS